MVHKVLGHVDCHGSDQRSVGRHESWAGHVLRFSPDPGYDDWYGYVYYGDFRGTPGDSSGWVRLLHEKYPHHYHWIFATNGWAVHGHAKASKGSIAGACSFCAAAFGAKAAIQAEGIQLLDEYDHHPSLRRLVDRGYQIITF